MTFLHGSDAYRLNEAVARFLADHHAAHDSRPLFLNLAEQDDRERLEAALATPPFLPERQLIVARDPLAADRLAEYLERSATGIDDADILLVQTTTAKPSSTQTAGLNRLARLATRVEPVEPLEGSALYSWITAFCQSRGRSIDLAVARDLVARAGTDTWTLANEMEKLCAYAESDITADTLELLVPRPLAADQWELSNALAGHDKRGAMTALWRRLQDGTPEPLLVGATASAIRTLVMIRDLADRPGQHAASIAKTSGLHPFVVSKNLRGAAVYLSASLRTALSALATLDRDAKSGWKDAGDALFSILLAL